MIFKVLIFSVLAFFTNAQIQNTGPCNRVTVVQDFDVAAYSGLWYQIVRAPYKFEVGNCSTARYGPVENGLVLVHNEEIVNGTLSTIDGTAELANPNSTEAKLIVKFYPGDPGADYWVLGTDYENYSVVYACKVNSIIHNVYAWILARHKPLSEEHLKAAHDILEQNGVIYGRLTKHDTPECEVQP